MTAAVQAPKGDRPVQATATEHRGDAGATLGEVELTARISDLLDHADEYQHLVDPRSSRRGVEDGVVSAVAAMTPALEERNAGADGVGAAWVYEFCQELGLDGIHVIEGVAAATRQAAAPGWPLDVTSAPRSHLQRGRWSYGTQ
jgi:hypothetical protein